MPFSKQQSVFDLFLVRIGRKRNFGTVSVLIAIGAGGHNIGWRVLSSLRFGNKVLSCCL